MRGYKRNELKKKKSAALKEVLQQEEKENKENTQNFRVYCRHCHEAVACGEVNRRMYARSIEQHLQTEHKDLCKRSNNKLGLLALPIVVVWAALGSQSGPAYSALKEGLLVLKKLRVPIEWD